MIGVALIEWLLASEIPSIRYLTRRRLLGQDEQDPQVQAERRAMTETGPIPAILAGQTEKGNWAGENSYYTPKYTSTHWSMTLLAELHAEPADPRLLRGVEFMLSMPINQAAKTATASADWECLWGNMLRYVAYAGFGRDERAEPLIRSLCQAALEQNWRCRGNSQLPCTWGAIRGLWGLAALPAGQRTGEVAQAIQVTLSWLLETNDLTTADYPTQQVSKYWDQLSFPLFYQADILLVLRLAAELDALDYPGARRALAWLQSRRDKQGRWHGASPFRRMWLSVAPDRTETDRWVSLFAADVIQKAEGIRAPGGD